MADVMTELHGLEVNFYNLQTEFHAFKNEVEHAVINEYNYSSINYKLKQLELGLESLKKEFEYKLRDLPVQQSLNIYYLEHKENYDKEFYSIYELSDFIIEKIFDGQNVHFGINSYSNEFSFNLSYNQNSDKNTYFQLSFLDCKDYLIQVSSIDESLTGTSCKYCVNSEKLVKSIKGKIFDVTMTT